MVNCRLLEKNPDDPQTLLLTSQDEILLIELMNQPWFLEYAIRKRDARAIIVDGSRRGHLKQALIRQGLPVEDTAGYQSGKPLPIQLNEQTLLGEPLSVRYYQEEAADSYRVGRIDPGGSGVGGFTLRRRKNHGGYGCDGQSQRAYTDSCDEHSRFASVER